MATVWILKSCLIVFPWVHIQTWKNLCSIECPVHIWKQEDERRWKLSKRLSGGVISWYLSHLNSWGLQNDREWLTKWKQSVNRVLIAFACNAKSFTIPFLVFLFFPFFPASGWTGKSFLRMFHELLPGICVTSAGLISSHPLCEKFSLNLKFRVCERSWHARCSREFSDCGSKQVWNLAF